MMLCWEGNPLLPLKFLLLVGSAFSCWPVGGMGAFLSAASADIVLIWNEKQRNVQSRLQAPHRLKLLSLFH